MQISPKLRKSSDGYLFYCPACEEAHKFRCVPEVGELPNWEFNGNIASPSFTPSLLHFQSYRAWTEADGPPRRLVRLPDGQRITICHLFVTDGKIVYCGDNPHALNGQTIDLPDLPEWMQSDKYGDGNP